MGPSSIVVCVECLCCCLGKVVESHVLDTRFRAIDIHELQWTTLHCTHNTGQLSWLWLSGAPSSAHFLHVYLYFSHVQFPFYRLADTFKRPTRWIDYCENTSKDNCTTDDNVASRAPLDETEAVKYFQQGSYTGHFIATDKNNCTLNANCTGHMIDYPCSWGAYTMSQLNWNDIFMESDTPDGSDTYTYSAMLQIIDAANATRR